MNKGGDRRNYLSFYSELINEFKSSMVWCSSQLSENNESSTAQRKRRSSFQCCSIFSFFCEIAQVMVFVHNI